MVTGLRNERKPCHFWVDNEVADCYQPIVGADAIWVYCRIARYAHGAWIVSPRLRGVDARVSLREMAEWCGKSVDTVWRCLMVLEHVGLLRADRAAKSKGRYALADVKDLVTSEGGSYDRELGSFQLPVARAATLKAEVKELRLKLARKTLVVIRGASAMKSVAQSDRLAGLLFAAPDEKCDRTVAPCATDLSLRATDNLLLEESKTAKLEDAPKSPSLRDGDSGPELRLEDSPLDEEQRAHLAKHADDGAFVVKWTAYYRERNLADAQAAAAARIETDRAAQVRVEDVDEAADRVLRAIGATAHRLRRKLRAVIEQRVEMGEVAGEVADRMIAAWKDYSSQGLRLYSHLSAAVFFEGPYWLNRNSWNWDKQTIRDESLAAKASVGSWG